MKESLVEPKLKGEKMENSKKVQVEKTAKETDNEKGKRFKQAETKNKESKKEVKKMEKEIKQKNKWIKPVIALSVIIILALFISTIFALININNQNIISGISIEGIDVSGLSREEAKAKLETIYIEKLEKEINIKYQEYESSLNPTLMEVKYDIDKAVEQAYAEGKEENIFINNYKILFALIRKKDINVEMTLNEEVTKQSIQDMGVNLPGVIIESSYFIEDGILTITKGKAGIVIDTENLLDKVKSILNDINEQKNEIEIPVVQKEPEQIDIDKIHGEVYKEVKDAYYTKNPFTIYPEVEGVDFDVEAAKTLIDTEDKEEYEIKLNITKPKVTVNQIGTEAFPDQLATFPTRYDPSARDRTTNLSIACQKINGKVVMPGEVFSYNQALGKRTAAAGYKNAAVYENGQVVDGIGGGICQISSTLYNAVLMANLEIVERRNHQFITSYLPAGRDATVVYGMTDFRFKNTRKYPIKIAASIRSGVATVSIYGIKEEQEYTFTFSTKTIASIPFGTKYIEDASLAAGIEKVKQKGANGVKTETYITKMLNGKVISTTLLSRDIYDAMQKIILKGTKGATQPTTPTTTTPVPSTPTPTTPSTQTPTTQPEEPKVENEKPSTDDTIVDTNPSTEEESKESENPTETN